MRAIRQANDKCGVYPLHKPNCVWFTLTALIKISGLEAKGQGERKEQGKLQPAMIVAFRVNVHQVDYEQTKVE